MKMIMKNGFFSFESDGNRPKNTISACKICRCRFYATPYITCPHEELWVCGCKNLRRSDQEMIDHRIYLTKQQLSHSDHF